MSREGRKKKGPMTERGYNIQKEKRIRIEMQRLSQRNYIEGHQESVASFGSHRETVSLSWPVLDLMF